MTTTQTQEPVAALTKRIMRRPASLGGYHYYIEAGTKVFVISTDGRMARVSCSASNRISSEDCFSVDFDSLAFPQSTTHELQIA